MTKHDIGEKKKAKMSLSRREHPLCSVPDCGRPNCSGGHCQTHHRQLLATGEVKGIRPYRERTPGTVKLAGLRLSPECAALLRQRADEGCGVILTWARERVWI